MNQSVILRSFLLLCVCLFCVFLAGCKPCNSKTKQLRINLATEPPTLDSRKAIDLTSTSVLVNIFEGLTRIGSDHCPEPALAEQIDISPDGRNYTFVLRPAVWSNGDPVEAEDFIYAWQSILDPQFPAPSAYKLFIIENAAEIKLGKLPKETLGVELINSKSFKVKLNRPAPYFLELLAFPTFFPINRKIDRHFADWANESGPYFVSNGPFCLERWDHESEILLTKNPNYWEAEAVKLEKIHFAMIEDTTTELYMYEMGELDWAGSPLSNLPADLISSLKEGKEDHDKEVLCHRTAGIYYYTLNTKKPPLNNVNIRRALALAIDRQAIVKYIVQSGQIPALAFVPPMPGWEPAGHYFDDSNAELSLNYFQQGLKELNLTKEHFPQLTLTYNSNCEHQKIAQAIQQRWKTVLGIDIRLQNYDWKAYLAKVNNMDYEIARMGWLGDFHDPLSFLQPFKYKDDQLMAINATGWEDSAFTLKLDQAEHELDPEKRAQLLRAAEKRLISQMPVIPIFYIVNCYLKKPTVFGIYLSPLGIVDYKKAYIDAALSY